MNIRVGFGYDVHRLVGGRKLILGGVEIPHSKGLTGHSDADVLIHAICDALLGAANMNDIGFHFSDKDPKFKNIDSALLMAEVVKMLAAHGYTIGNIDSTISLQTPRISSFIPQMKEKLARILSTSEENISIKATTTEKLGFEGREEGVSAYAVALIKKD